MAKVSTLPETFEGGAGFLDGWETEITGAEYVAFDGNGHWENESPCLCLTLENDQMEKPSYQYFSAGSLANFVPSEDGTYLEVVGKRNGLHPSCTLAHLWKSFIDAGAPRAFMEAAVENVSILVGTKIRWQSVKLRKDSKYGTPLVDEILYLPEESPEPEDVAAEVVMAVLAANNGEINVRQFPKAAKAVLADKGLDKKIAKEVGVYLFSKDFLSNGDGWTTEGQTIKAAA